MEHQASSGNGADVPVNAGRDGGTVETVAVVPHGGAHESGSAGPLKPDTQMLVLTWITFGILAAVLYRVAWKPILKGLQDREDSIRKALEDAGKARAELAASEERTRLMISEARAEGEKIVADARASASDLAASIEKRARERDTALAAEAQRQIAAAAERARAVLRTEAAELAISLAGRIVGENMDADKNRQLVKKLVSEN